MMQDASIPKRRARNSLNQAEIVQASLEIINQEGVDGFSMRRISKKLGCSIASPYSYFKGQQEILGLVIFEGERRLAEMISSSRTVGNTTFKRLTSIAEAYFNFSGKNRELHKAMGKTSFRRRYKKTFPILSLGYRIFLRTIRDGVYSKEFQISSREIPLIARAMYSWIYGIVSLVSEDSSGRRNKEDSLQEGISLFHKLLLRESS
ncbi:hypothetical protein CH352_02480 [Leptospira hartskeerlii]|uniref:HTH tetR-type domain-containing protein n=1 Tax=Leptospira hartskeerlii TaxID=2023177 RepID=A0A2M9XDB0_9LEPT|nr:helix-turn-helix domain-containing protein [Leptospira hartskeerlii]PJZ25681.1 hypothetical protein CH357_08495 [Leptospira hartskeerlii]PJZ35496.1 hypothetical protein CH352_02480 [Leptospira hartskeerlii]